jgi:hypothetical protein
VRDKWRVHASQREYASMLVWCVFSLVHDHIKKAEDGEIWMSSWPDHVSPFFLAAIHPTKQNVRIKLQFNIEIESNGIYAVYTASNKSCSLLMAAGPQFHFHFHSLHSQICHTYPFLALRQAHTNQMDRQLSRVGCFEGS